MSRRPQPLQYRSWLFTLNNYTQDEFSAIKVWCQSSCDYAVIGEEVGEAGTPHLQGYFRSKVKCRLSQIKDQVSGRAHFEAARGSPADNRAYCTKDRVFWEVGTCPRANGRTTKSRDEIAIEWNAAWESRTLPVFAAANPGVYLFSRHTMLRNTLGAAEPLDRPGISVEWIWGPPGVGKSRLAHARFPGGFIKDPRTKWWTGYKLELDVIIDDFAPKGIDMNHLLRWFDRYRCTVETKGDIVALHAVNWVVTSNFSPDDCFRAEDGGPHLQIDALRRRMKVTHMLEYPGFTHGGTHLDNPHV